MTRRRSGQPGTTVAPLVRWTPVLALALGVPVVPLGTGCETSCSVDEEPHPEDVHTGLTNVEKGTYASDEWNGPYHHLPPKKRYRFFHGLNGIPRDVKTWVGFVKSPLDRDGKGNIAESAGNIVVIQDVTPQYIQVRNDTCETFYLRVYASDPEAPARAEAGTAGTLDGQGGADGSVEDALRGGAPDADG